MIRVERIVVLCDDGRRRVVYREKPIPLAHKDALEHFRSTLKMKYQTTEVRFEYEEDEVV